MGKLKKNEIITELSKISGWEVIDEDSISKLSKEFHFENFVQALDFANKVGILAEEFNHHPRIILEWGKVTTAWWSHSEGGIIQSDFDMAEKLNNIKT